MLALPLSEDRRELYCVTHVVLHTRGAQVCGQPFTLSVSSLPVAFQQFSLAAGRCPDRQDRALLMKVGSHVKS